jgi:hypothetical protein
MRGKKKIEVPLFDKKKQRGRPIKYDFSAFKKQSTSHLVLQGIGQKEYDSLRSTFARWRRMENIKGRFHYDFIDNGIAIWRK